MFYHFPKLRLLTGALLTLFVLLSACCVMSAELDDEAAAAALYKSATERMQTALLHSVAPDESCLAAYRQAYTQYPDTEIAKWARMRAASCLIYLCDYEGAVTECQSVVDAYPGELVAAWAQFHQAMALEVLKKHREAMGAFFKVEAYSNLADHSPIDIARRRAGNMFFHVKRNMKFNMAMQECGISQEDSRKMAWFIMATAIAKADGSEFGYSEAYLRQLKSDFTQYGEYVVALEAALGGRLLDYSDRYPDRDDAKALGTRGVDLLSSVRQSAGLESFVGSKAMLRLAQYQMDTERDLPAAELTLREMQDQAPDCEIAREGKYRLAQCLHNQKKYAEAADQF